MEVVTFLTVIVDGTLKDGVPSDQEIAVLALHIMDGQMWKRLGRALSIGEPFITQIQEDEYYAYERAYKLLNTWRQVMGEGANYESLAQALGCEEISRADLVQRFCYLVETQGNFKTTAFNMKTIKLFLKLFLKV